MDAEALPRRIDWRELAREVAVVVTGVVIALTLGEIVRAIHDRQLEGDTRAVVRSEIADNLVAIARRDAVKPCVDRRLAEVGGLLERSGEGPLVPVPSWIGQPNARLLATQRFQLATASGHASLLGLDEQARYAELYVNVADYASEISHEQQAWAQLRGLEHWYGALGSAGRVHFASALQQARLSAWIINFEIRNIAGRAARLGLPFLPPADQQRVARAVCLPIGTPRADAQRLLAGNIGVQFGQPE